MKWKADYKTRWGHEQKTVWRQINRRKKTRSRKRTNKLKQSRKEIIVQNWTYQYRKVK